MKENLLIFGCGDNQATLIKTAKDLGYYTIAIDPNKDAVARNLADLYFVVPV